MSLKTFHIVFISLSAILAAGSAAWAVSTVDGALGLALGGLSLAAGVGLVLYGRRFLRKMKELEAAG